MARINILETWEQFAGRQLAALARLMIQARERREATDAEWQAFREQYMAQGSGVFPQLTKGGKKKGGKAKC
jgi:hypothetical protein